MTTNNKEEIEDLNRFLVMKLEGLLKVLPFIQDPDVLTLMTESLKELGKRINEENNK